MEQTSSCYADEMEFVECAKKCEKCGAPIHYKKNQGIPFCWECVVNKENARRGRELLEKLKARASSTDESGNHSNWIVGAAL